MAPLQGPESAPDYESRMENIANNATVEGTTNPADRTKVVVVGLGMVRLAYEDISRQSGCTLFDGTLLLTEFRLAWDS